jgi:NAD-dependent deacetylase
MTIRLRDFERIVFFTGAGMSAESGVPTYRGKGGIWKSYDYGSCACQAAFDRNPRYVWEFHNYRRGLIAQSEPNEGHFAIARTQAARPNTCVVTQNVDGLHQRAGSGDVHELHGNIWQVRCDRCGWRQETREVPLVELTCPECGAFKRPNLVWFGDTLFPDVLRTVDELLRACDVLVSIGTSAVVYPAADMPLIARQGGAELIEVNPEETPLSHIYKYHYRTTASAALVELCRDM